MALLRHSRRAAAAQREVCFAREAAFVPPAERGRDIAAAMSLPKLIGRDIGRGEGALLTRHPKKVAG